MYSYRELATIIVAINIAACATHDHEDALVVTRESIPTVDMHAPTAADEVVATLAPGKPFLFAGRYWYASGSGVQPDMTRFAPAHVAAIPRILAGDTVAVLRGGQTSHARLVMSERGGPLLFVPQQDSPFVHSFARVPWSAWNGRATAVQTCAADVDDEQSTCDELVQGDYTACAGAAALELGQCASNQNDAVPDALGVATPLQFECLFPAGTTTSALGISVNFLGCDCEFWGSITWQPGDDGCEMIYDGSIENCEEACEGEGVWDVEGPIHP
jgi:hypothetical protein